MTAKAKVRIEGEDATATAWRKAMGTAQTASKKMSAIFKGAFAGVSIAVVANLGREAIEAGDNLNKFATRAKIAGKEASTLAYAAKQADVDLDSLTTSVQKMQIFLSKAASGEKANVEALDALGIKLSDIKDLAADKQFELIADKVSKLASEEDRARAVTEVFGKAGGALLPMFEQGAEGIRKARIEAEKLGYAFNDAQLEKIARADDALKRMNASWKTMWITIAEGVSPAVIRLSDAITGIDTSNLDEKISDLKQSIDNPVVGTARHRKSVDEMRAELDALIRLRQTGVINRGDGKIAEAAPPGFKPDDTKAVAAAEKERAKAEQQRIDGMIQKEEEFRDALKETREENENLDEYLRDSQEQAGEDVLGTLEEAGQALEDLKIEDPWTEQLEVFQDGFMNAFDDMVNTGKIKWDELLKYWVTELLRSQILKLFEAMKGTGGTGGIGGFVGGLFGGLSKIFGFADGGRPQPGVPYVVGERGPELRVDGPGSIIPNHALGGGMVFAPVYNIDARGATADLAKALPRILRDNNRSLSAEIFERIKRSDYPQ